MIAKAKAKTKKAQPKVKSPITEKTKGGVAARKSKSASAADGKKVKTEEKSKAQASSTIVRVVNKISAPRVSSDERKATSKGLRIPQFNYMKAPGLAHDFQVGDKVEVFCDHEKSKERIRGWIAGIVVQVDNKMVAVQFRSNVFLTDGWMVPDRILWYPLTSEHIRPIAGKKSAKKEKVIPDY